MEKDGDEMHITQIYSIKTEFYHDELAKTNFDKKVWS